MSYFDANDRLDDRFSEIGGVTSVAQVLLEYVPVAYTFGAVLPPVGLTDHGVVIESDAVPESPALSVQVPSVFGPVGVALAVIALPSSAPFPASIARTT